MHVARDALQAKLPPYWRPCKTDEGAVFYFHFGTGETSWDDPNDAVFRHRVAELRAAKNTYASMTLESSWFHSSEIMSVLGCRKGISKFEFRSLFEFHCLLIFFFLNSFSTYIFYSFS